MNDGDLMAVLVNVLERSRQGWNNAIELGLIPPQHHESAKALAEEAREAIAAWNTRADAKAGSENTTAFLRDLAQRIFINATPRMGFDQGDVDRLYAIASVLADAPPVKQSLTSEGDLRSALEPILAAIAKSGKVEEMDWHHIAALQAASAAEPVGLREALHSQGWRVAVHNDYRLNNEDHTFWLFTHADGRWIKGEGKTDAEAIAKAAAQAALNTPARTDDAGQPSGDVAAMREAAAKVILPILWKSQCYNGVTFERIDRHRVGGPEAMGGLVEKYEAQAISIADAVIRALPIPAAEEKPAVTIDFSDMMRPIIGIENRTAQEAFDIMRDRMRLAEVGHYRLAALTSSPSPAGDLREWRPIQTAPKDGSRVNLCWREVGGLSAHVELGKFSPSSGWCNTYGKAFGGDPDYWLALPIPPAALQKGSGR